MYSTTIIKIKNYTALMLLLGLSMPNSALAAATFDTILTNLQMVLPALVNIVMVVSFLCGLYFIVRGLMMLKAFGMPLTQMTRPGELGGPLAYIIIGAILIYLPTSLEVTHASIFGAGDTYLSGAREAEYVYGYPAGGTIDEQWESLKNVIYKYIQFIGLIAFVRGLLIMGKSGQPGVQPGTINKGLIHIIAGVIAINIKGFLDILRTTVGL